MGIRETISYNKNFITGKEIVVKKDKNTDVPMINVTTVQLFDAVTGELTYEAKAENLVNNIISKLAYMDYFYYRIIGSISNYNFTPPWQVLILTNYTGAEDPDCYYAKGNLIGWADKTTAYAGASSIQGTINSSETKLDVNKTGNVHFVFDFPTNAANGTFQTVWWSDNYYNTLIGYKSSPSRASNDSISVCSNGLTTFDSYYSILWTKYTSTDLTLIDNIKPVGAPAINISGMDYDGVNVYVLDFTNKKLHKFAGDMSTWISSINITGYNVNWGTTALDMTELNGVIYFSTNYVFMVAVNKTTGIIISATDLRLILGYTANFTTLFYFSLTSDGVDKFYIGVYASSLLPNPSNFILVLDTSFTCVGMLADSGGTYVMKLSYDRSSKDLYAFDFYNSTYGIRRFLMVRSSPGAQNLLAAPVTKTAAQTMKIQYDFNIQKIF